MPEPTNIPQNGSMSHPTLDIRIRSFLPSDSGYCYQLRKECFLNIFIDEIGETAALAGANAYQPADFILISQKKHCFIIEEEEGNPLGFFILSRVDQPTAEIFLIYLEGAHHGQGVGKHCMDYIDRWVTSQWPDTDTIIVDTVIPGYNGGFYQKMGYRKLTETDCQFPGKTVPAIRFQKRLR